SGCFPDFVCTLPNFDATNNPALPWQGDHTPFCMGEPQTGAVCDDGDGNTIDDIIQADCGCAGTLACGHPDYDALMALYNATDGANWTFSGTNADPGSTSAGWGKDCEPCQWYGITCDANDRVICIDLDGINDCDYAGDLTGNSLSGPLPAAFDNLPFLRFLYLGENNLTGNIPDFTNLPSLEECFLSFNQLDGAIPDFSNLPNLTLFTCGYNALTGTIPDFSNLPNLALFSCSHNQITGNIPDFTSLPNLAYFTCGYNQLTGNIPDFTSVPNLYWFSCTDNLLDGSIPDFTNLPNLEHFTCSFNNLTGTIPDFTNLPVLDYFYCRNNDLSGCFPDFVCTLPNFDATNNPALPWQGDHTPFCMGEPQTGAICDDGDGSTIDDIIQADCNCAGTLACALTLTSSTTPATCGTPTGSATITVDGGGGPYTFDWSTGDATTEPTLAGLAPGDYSVTVSEGACSEITAFTVADSNMPVTQPVSATICPQDTFYIGTTPYTQSGSYFGVVTGSNGCDSTVLLSLSVLPAAESFLDATFCAGDGDSYTVNGTVYNENNPAGTEVFPGLAANGCDSVVYIDLTILQPDVDVTNVSACYGEVVTINGFDLSINTPFYADTMANGAANGCDLIEQYQFVPYPTVANIDTTVCAGTELNLFGTTFNEANPSGTLFTGLTPVNRPECDSIWLVNVQFHTAESDYADLLCANESLTIGDQTFDIDNPSGQAILPGAGYLGCDSVVHVMLTFQTAVVADFTDTACESDIVTVGGQPFTAANPSGTVTLAGAATGGCDSLINVDITFLPQVETMLEESLCAGEPYLYDGTTYFAPATIQDQFTSASGCDSLLTIELLELPAYDLQLDSVICTGESVTVGGQTFAAPGVYPVALQTAAGCDSLLTLDLQVFPALTASLDTTLCAGESLLLNGETFDENNPGGVQTLTAVSGCDSVLTVNVSFYQPMPATLDTILCAGESLSLGGQTFSDPIDLMTVTLPGAGAFGCDSLVRLTLGFYPTHETEQTATICAGDSYDFYGRPLTTAGAYTQPFVNQYGCDSIILFYLSVTPVDTLLLTEIICPGDSYDFCGQSLSEEGLYECYVPGAQGCDSLIQLNLLLETPGQLLAEDDDYAFLRSDEEIEMDLLGNDILEEGYSFELLSQPGSGELIFINEVGLFRPDGIFIGQDSFQYALCPTEECLTACDTATVRLDIDFNCLTELSVQLPTAFSPQATAEINRVFDPIQVTTNSPECPFEGKLEMLIINRNSEVVFRPANGYAAWEGKNNRGEPLPEGTYFYILEYEDEVVRGPIMLLRR
ncbi:MAG: gliding motility-associated C-terminal domain-containing protein, partial [Lewinella sp.]|nr:gliding motility-associated C-terminal domain-containing protein [Lewinella sp.]